MVKGLLSLFLKPNCPLCQRPAENILCTFCERKLETARFTNPLQFWQQPQPLFVWGKYDGQLKRAIAAFKYDNKPELGEYFGYQLGEFWLRVNPLKSAGRLTIIPIPLHPQKQKERGFNQAELIAKAFCQFTRDRLESQALLRVRNTEALFNLSPQQRQTNLHQAFQVNPPFLQKSLKQPILLIDDIYTTGTTVKETTRMLRAQGFSVLGVAAIATSHSSFEQPSPFKKQ
ncbi:MAG: ComF family protein [Snowella sp.]|nr:ComF family protein [Snowella sp.]